MIIVYANLRQMNIQDIEVDYLMKIGVIKILAQSVEKKYII